ncbi:Putative Alcohol dehydrogenase [Nostocoides japonicum T1-X7]|uniref:Putative Alcohol dehydrogenase n=1 Tax=Nostocoides japonicum T1-X7 TaxID=1194083 RepID=A0A077M4A6_9MICO|nr:zinc-dependent alcohol dehydrogenase family protein [Tetrasphaera japonica]CCH78677.1 Putative Alcohol dehydrogenase [Tetrasphaera japonica T1-X7]CCH79932.1 Putative Alcohol dehydrogenase [Tetrasphaera japonica T1-X7]
MQITAAVLSSVGVPTPYVSSNPLRLQRLELDPPGPGEVLVRVAAAGLCHSDLSVINGNRIRPTPMALGHEAAGVVEEVVPTPGLSGGTDLAPGDHVVFVFVPSCGRCEPCSGGRPALCEPGAAANTAGTLLSGERRLHASDGSQVHHHLGVSAFADHAVVSRASLVKVDPDLPLEEAALFGCAVLTGVGAVFNTARAEAGSSVAVVGLGGVGLSSLLGAIAAGARTVVAVDLSAEKLALAERLGATHAVNAGDPEAAEQIRSLTRGGVDYAFELAGSARALDLAFSVTRRGGTTVTAGLTRPDVRLPLSPVTLVAEERTLKGSYIGTAVPGRDIPRYIELYRRGRLPVDRLLSGTSPLSDINAGFDLLDSGQAVRHVVTMSEAGY